MIYMANNYTPRRAAPSGDPAPRRSTSRDTGYPSSSREYAPRDSRYTPDNRAGAPRDSQYSPQNRPVRAPRPAAPRQEEEDLYIRRRPPQTRRRRKKSGPPLLPILVLVLLVAIAVAIVFAVRGCSSKPEDGGNSSSSQASQAAPEGSGASGDSSAGSAAPTPSPVPDDPTPAPQEEPSAAPEQAGNLMIVGDTAYEYYNFNEDAANDYILAVTGAGDKLSGTATVYDMIIPTSIDIDLPESYLEKFSSQINSNDQRKAIEDYIYPSIQSINSSVKTVSIYDTLKAHANEYLYFRTDHHWTALGAYYAYVEFCEARGFDPVPLEDFEKKEFEGYLGSFYSSSSEAMAALGNNPDTVEAYVPKPNVTLYVMQENGEELPDWPLIADADTYSAGNKYLAFCGGDQPYEEITNNDMTNGPSCIVVKESFGNCFIPYLVNHYKKVYVVDYRYYDSTVTQLARDKGVDDVICVNNISMTRNEGLVDQFTAIF